MKRQIIELYNDRVVIQKNTQEQADEVFAMYEGTEDPHYQNLLQREVEVAIAEQAEAPIEVKPDFLGFEQALYQSPLLQKGLLSQGNGFAFLLKVLTDGKTTGASENALLQAIQATLAGLQGGQNALTSQEISDLNELLLQYHFTIQIG